MRAKYQDKLIGASVTLLAALIAFYFGSFASKAQVSNVEAKVINLSSSLKEEYAKKTDIILLDQKLQHLKEGQMEIKQLLKKIK